MADMKWIPKGRNKLVFGIMSCADVTFTLYETSDQSNQYVLFYLGYYQNNYALIIPSSDCDDSGNCDIRFFSEGMYLDCSNFAFFWMSWDLTGKVTLGSGDEIGVGTLMEITNGLTVEPYYADVLFDDPSGGQIYVFIDDPPVPLNPLPDGTTVFEVYETNVIHNALYTAEASDPEADPVAFYVLDEHSDVFTFSDTTLTNIAPLDYEKHCEYAVKVTIYDNANIVTTMLTIKVLNVFDEPPNVDAVSVSLPEELSIGSFIDSGLTVSDADVGDQLTYSLSGSHASYFEVTADGRFKVAERIDFDPPNSIKQLDQLTLIVTDLNSNSNSTTLTFAVTDVNDMKPTFSQAVYSAEVTEGSGTVSLLQLTITDADSGVNAEYDVTMDGDDPSDPAFTFDPSTLQLSVDANKLDYESLEASAFTSTLTFVATDKATEYEPRTGSTVALIKVLPDNEFTPVWSATPMDLTIDESSPPGTVIGSYIATDGDLSLHGDVTYQVVSLVTDQGVDAMGTFFLDSGTGELRVASPVDADTQTGGAAFYDITIQAADCCSKNVQASFKIFIFGENDNAPSFSEVSYQAELSEDAVIHSVVLDLQATDADWDILTYTLLGNGNELFQYTSPGLIVYGPLDYETKRCFFLTLRASDGVHETDVPVNINIRNVIDEAPVLTVNTPISLTEEQPVGTPLGGVYDVTDRDENDTLTFSLEGSESSYFYIDSTTGVIILEQRIDREGGLTSISDVTLKVTDSGGNVASATLTFDIVDINDNSPQFSSDVIHIEVTENTPHDMLLSSLEVTDGDAGDNAEVVVSIISGDDDSPDEKFQLIGTEVRTSGTYIDYEALSSANFLYTLTVQAVDQPTTEAAKTAVAVVVVTVVPENERTPTWDTAPSDMTVSESRDAGSQLGHYTATDDDVGRDGDITYQLVSVTDDSGGDGSEKFHLDSGDGKLLLACPLDYDKPTGGAAYYDVTMKAVDGGVTAKFVETTFRISVGAENDNAPKFAESLYQAVVTEQADIHTSLFSVVANDADDDVLTYTLVGDGTDMFAYDDLNNLITSSTLDYESHRCYTFILRVNDGLHEVDVPVSINVSNVIDETPVLTVNTPIILFEEQPVDTPLGGVYVVTDRDEDDTFTYSLEGTGSSFFSIDPSSGLMTLAERMDREAGLTYITDVTLKVTDAGGNVASEALIFDIVDINDNSPQFSSDVIHLEVTENTPPDMLLSTLEVTDGDAGDNAKVVVSIISGDDDSPDEKFQLIGTEVRTSGTFIDYEALSSANFLYTLTVQAVDQPTTEAAKTAVAVVVVTVVSENEHTPTWDTAPSDMTVSESRDAGSQLGHYTATDDDVGRDGDVTYQLVSVTDDSGGDGFEKFHLDSGDGKLLLACPLDYDKPTGGAAYYDVTMKAVDGGVTALFVETTFRISVGAENDNAPKFAESLYQAVVTEQADIHTSLFSAVANDADDDVLTYTLVGDGTDMFAYDDLNNLIMSSTLDYESHRCYTFLLRVNDGLHEVDVPVSINVSNVIDETPVLTVNTPIILFEEQPVDTPLGGVYVVTDRDEDDTFTYSLEGTGSSYFSIDPSSGLMTLAQRMDREAGLTFITDVTLKVTDAGGNVASEALIFDIVDINDNSPQFSSDVIHLEVTENTPQDMLLSTLEVTDGDAGDNAKVVVSIISGDDDSPDEKFQLIGTEVRTSGTFIDYEALSSANFLYTLTVQAVDQPTTEAAKTAVAVVVVTVVSENEHTPTWDTAPIDMTVSESRDAGSQLGHYTATDDDVGRDGDVTYQLVSVTDDSGGDGSEKFHLDSGDGKLLLASTLDYDKPTGGATYFDVTMKAVDGGVTAKFVETTFRIFVGAENDNAPKFAESLYQAVVTEQADIHTSLFSAVANDADDDVLTYTLVGDGTDMFAYEDLNNLITSSTLDYESHRCYTFILRVNDGLHEVDVPVSINVSNVIDETPVLTVNTPIILFEEQPVDTPLGGVYVVTDRDEDDTFTYSLEGTGSSYFSIDPSTGLMTLGQRMDREAGLTFITDVTLKVTDAGGNVASETLTFDIVDINDNSPQFSSDVVYVNVSENTAYG
ncbi:cadherin-23-like [Haliotis rufescens]|uniref:cadherin-23-like n=1 Tax=Haliotis rufescens TaxID=6454 RepID=UPI00201F3012|nr:cadherin-23-like [Haliotis rufescens]